MLNNDQARLNGNHTGPGGMNKDQIIAGIQQINRSARRDWLDEFDTPALHHYLDHLHQGMEPRGGHSVWVRQHETPAVVTREPSG